MKYVPLTVTRPFADRLMSRDNEYDQHTLAAINIFACLRMAFVAIIMFVMIGLFDTVDSKAIVVNNGTLFTAIKCRDFSETFCIRDSPSKTHTSISKGQCINACNRLGWNWFNFIADERSIQRGFGTCQLFATEPKNLTKSSSCIAYKKAPATLADRTAVSLCKSLGKQSISPHLVYAVRQISPIYASALYDGMLYFSTQAARVYAYDAMSMSPNGQLAIRGLSEQMFGLTINITNGNLYLSDYNNSLVRFMNLDNPSIGGSWIVNGPIGLSINGAGNILVSSYSDNKTIEYTARGMLIREIPFSANVRPWQTLELSNNTFVVTSRDGWHVVLTTTSTGQVINSYGSSAGSGAGQMNMPRGVVVDDDGFFIVADRNNNRVLVLNPSLSDVRKLPIPSNVNLVLPQSLSYDTARGRLYVGESGGTNRMLVFDGITNLRSLFY